MSIIKVLTGIRRCGKSLLLEMVGDMLRERGISSDRIIAANFESKVAIVGVI